MQSRVHCGLETLLAYAQYPKVNYAADHMLESIYTAKEIQVITYKFCPISYHKVTQPQDV